MEQAFRNLLKRRKLLIRSLLLSLLVGLAAKFALQKSLHSFEGTLLYTPNSITAPYYAPPSLSNLVHLVESPTLLEKLREEYDLDDSLSDLKRKIKFELVPGGDTMVVRATRHDPEEAKALVNSAMQLFVDKTRDLRKQNLERFVAEFESDMVLGKKNVDEANSRLRMFLEANGLESADSLLTTANGLQEDVRDLDMELEMARIEQASNLAKREKLLSTQEEQDHPIKKDDMQILPAAKMAPLSNTSDLRNFLKDQIVQERLSSSYAVKLKVKERERDRAKSLHEQQLISDAEMDAH